MQILRKRVPPSLIRYARWIMIAGSLGLLAYALFRIGISVYEAAASERQYRDIQAVYNAAADGATNGAAKTAEPEETAAKIAGEPRQQAVPAQPGDGKAAVLGKFEPLLAENADTVGWIAIEGTGIDYPVVQADDNDFYLQRGYDGANNAAGSIFMDYRNAIDDNSEHASKWRNTILYGHRMKNGTMFAALKNYLDEHFFASHRLIEFDTLYGEMKWQVFAVYVTDTSFDYIRTEFENDFQYMAFLASLQKKSMYPADVELTPADEILTLSTCDYSVADARLVVHARRYRPAEEDAAAAKRERLTDRGAIPHGNNENARYTG